LKLLSVLIILSLFPAYGLELPKKAFKIDDIIKEFRVPLELKISELQKNYISHKNGRNASFKSHEDTTCSWVKAPAGETLAKIQMSVKNEENRLTESVFYTGCHDQLNLKELVVTTGKNLKPLSEIDLFEGRRNFELKENELSRYYSLRAWDDQELFRLTLRRVGKGIVAEFFIREQRFMNMTLTSDDLSNRITYTFYPYDIKYKRKHSSWSINRGRATYSLSAIKNTSADSREYYLNSTFEEISGSTFQVYFGYSVLQSSITRLSSFMKWHLFLFPTTEFASSGVQSSRFLDELRLTFTRLLSNTDLNLVRNLVQSYIRLIEEGVIKIIDSRPAEE
jgi:hypothetical protein